MANRQTRNPGSVQRFQPRGQVRTSVPGFAADTGATWRAMSRQGSKLSATLGQAADRAAAREGQEAGLIAGASSGAQYLARREADARAAARASRGRPPRGGSAADDEIEEPQEAKPLALRRDGTIRGQAFDQAATGAFAWRVESGMAQALVEAHDNSDGDPAAFAAALGGVRAEYVTGAAGGDPQLTEVLERRFTQRAQTLVRSVAAEGQRQARASHAAAVAEGLSSGARLLERQAYLLGANPEGDDVLEEELARAGRSIDAAVSQGVLTPRQGLAQKDRLARGLATARVRGVFDALEDPAAQESFATGLIEDWAEGQGPLAALDYDTVRALSDTLYGRARAERNRQTAGNRLERARAARLIEDDIASVAATGEGLDWDEVGLDPAQVSGIAGEAAAIRWQEDRTRGQRVFEATNGMEFETGQELAERLAAIEPKPGTPGFAEDLRVFDAAEKRATDIVRQRTRDPAGAALEAYPDIAELGADPASTVTARLDAQGALEIPPTAQRPLTQAEAAGMAAALRGAQDDATRTAVIGELAAQIDEQFGKHGDRVLSQVLEAAGANDRMARFGAAMMRRIQEGQVDLDPASMSDAAVTDETGLADRAAEPIADDAVPLPNYEQIQMLLEQPELAPQFDEKFGPGMADRYLNIAPPPAQPDQDAGTTIVAPDGTESFVPNDGAAGE